MNFQQLILALQSYWAQQGCVLGQPYDVEKGAGTANPHTFLRSLGPEPWNVAYVEPCRRPTDGRYGENPNRLGAYYQFQVILKPSPKDVLDRYLRGLTALGIDPRKHDIRFVEDDWEQPTLGAWGLGWEVWLNGMEITQFTYFQQVGGIECRPVCAEITYGIERLAMYLQGVDDYKDIEWVPGVSYAEVHYQTEVEWSRFNFEEADPKVLFRLFDDYYEESRRLADRGLVFPAYDFSLRCGHTFNTLDARGAISVAERAAYLGRIRDLSRVCAKAFVEARENLGHPLLKGRPAATPLGRQVAADAERLAAGEGTAELDVGALPEGGTSELLLELGAEEIPAGFLGRAERDLARSVLQLLDDGGVAHGAARTFSTPRRIVLVVDDVAHRSPAAEEVVTGPPAAIAFDAEGRPKVPALKFAEGQGVPVEELFTVSKGKKGDYLACRKRTGGESALRLLASGLSEVVARLPWKKSMRWGAGPARFARPLHWMTALLGGVHVPFHFADVASGTTSRGHRFFGDEAFEVRDFASLAAGLKERSVVLDAAERRASIERQLGDAASTVAGEVVLDAALLDTVVGLVEFPNVQVGTFDVKYLELPEEVIATVLTHHQKMFTVRSPDGPLLNHFLGVSNNPVEHQPLVVAGYERVVSARLADGAFFFANDRRKTLAEIGAGLGSRTFLQGVGTLAEKADRLESLALALGRAAGASADEVVAAARAAKLAKADLCSEVVGEFANLQGVMGRIYAAADGEGEAVAEAVFEHYLPRGADDALPAGVPGAIAALADKADMLAACFGIGKQPTGSADPFALRRSALGVLRILRGGRVRVTLTRLLAEAMAGLDASRTEPGDAVSLALMDFLRGRLKNLWTSEGTPTDLAEAVLLAGFDDLPDAEARMSALRELQQDGSFTDLMAAFKRMGNIVRKAREGGELQGELGALDAGRLEDGAERALYDAFLALRDTVHDAIEDHDYPTALSAMVSLRAPLATFFDDVLVMHDDDAVRTNRLTLLARIGEAFEHIADFSAISTE